MPASRTPPRPARRRPWLLAGAVALALVAALVLIRRALQPGPPAPGFVLRDQRGRLTSLAQFRGKVVVLTFIDPQCTQICPLTTESMLRALRLLGPAAAAQVQLLGVDVNARQTSPADLDAYTRAHGLQGRWRFLGGTPAQLAGVWRDYGIHVQIANGDIEHEAVMVLIDPDGRQRDMFATPMSYAAVGDQARDLARGIARLLPSHPTVAPAPAAATAPPPSRNTTLTLRSLGPGAEPVRLGGAHAHLVVFFAGWLAPPAELARKLAPLASYAAAAPRQGWPSPVAVDVLTTEPDPAQARRQSAALAAQIRLPVVADASGWIADDYHVGDLPWYVLTSGSGDILWRHDGWLSSSDLARALRLARAH